MAVENANPTPNLLAPLPDARAHEVFTELARHPGCRIERIVSQGQSTPEQQPYLQAHDEWVLVLAGSARVRMREQEHALEAGDHLFIPGGVRHWVSFTDPDQPTVWLAVHIGEAD